MQEIKEVFDEHCNLEERKGDSNKGEKSVEGEGRKVRGGIDLGKGTNFSVHFLHTHLN